MDKNAIRHKSDRQLYIDGLKGLACLLIMFGHYLGLYKYAQEFVPRITFLDVVLESHWKFLLDESFWLYLFFAISGYLVAKSKVTSMGVFIKKSILRFLRLALPVLGAYVFIYGIYALVGFHNGEANAFFICEFYERYYHDTYTLKDVLIGPFEVLIKGGAYLNRPYWVLKYMLIASVIIYLCKYLYRRFKLQDSALTILIIVLIFAFEYKFPVISACLMGALLELWDGKKLSDQPSYFYGIVIISCFCLYVIPKELYATLIFVMIMWCISWFDGAKKVLSSKVCVLFGKLSWGIYSFHWPIICSFGAIVICRYAERLGLLSAYLISYALCVCITLVISCLYEVTFSVAIDKIMKAISQFLFEQTKEKS